MSTSDLHAHSLRFTRDEERHAALHTAYVHKNRNKCQTGKQLQQQQNWYNKQATRLQFIPFCKRLTNEDQDEMSNMHKHRKCMTTTTMMMMAIMMMSISIQRIQAFQSTEHSQYAHLMEDR